MKLEIQGVNKNKNQNVNNKRTVTITQDWFHVN